MKKSNITRIARDALLVKQAYQ